MGALLANAIDRLDDDTVFYIGSKTSFFFIGNKAEWEHDKDQVENWCYEFTLRARDEAQVVWENLLYSGLPKRSDYVEYDRWNQDSMHAVKVLSMAQNRLIDSNKAVKKYKPVLKRGIMESYDRNIPGELAGKIFIVSGVEVGKYWFHNEYISKAEVGDED